MSGHTSHDKPLGFLASKPFIVTNSSFNLIFQSCIQYFMTLCSLGFASYNLLIQKKRNRPTLLEHLHEFKAVIVVILHCCLVKKIE